MKTMHLICSYGAIRKQTLYDVWTGEHECGAVYTKGGYIWAYKEGTSKPHLVKHNHPMVVTYKQARRWVSKHFYDVDWENWPAQIKVALGLRAKKA